MNELRYDRKDKAKIFEMCCIVDVLARYDFDFSVTCDKDDPTKVVLTIEKPEEYLAFVQSELANGGEKVSAV